MENLKAFLIEKLNLFMGETEAKNAVSKAIKIVGLPDKDKYTKEESMMILDQMKKCGGYQTFVASHAYIALLSG